MKFSALPIFVFSAALAASSHAAITSAGDLMITGYNADGTDNLSFVLLKDYTANSVIFFTDNEWDGSAFNADETFFQWSSLVDITAGTVITLNGIGSTDQLALSASVGSAVTNDPNNPGLATSNDAVYAYLGATFDTTTPTFLSAIANSGFTANTGGALLDNTGLTSGSTAVQFTNGHDIYEYNGDRNSQQSFGNYVALIGNTANWISQDGTGDQSADGVAPNVPFNTSSFAVVPEPGAPLLLALAGLTAFATRRRRSD